MKIQVISDTHLEHRTSLDVVPGMTDDEYSKLFFQTQRLALLKSRAKYLDSISVHPDADVLVLAGDITDIRGWERLDKTDWFDRPSLRIIYVPGNHEYYSSSLSAMQGIQELLYGRPNVEVVNNDFVEIGDVIFICATMWSDIRSKLHDPTTAFWSDFIATDGFKPDQYQHMHEQSTCFIEGALSKFRKLKKKVVVVTHHVPTWENLTNKYMDHPDNAFFRTRMDYLMRDEHLAPDVWIYGHTHDAFDGLLHRTRLVCNPRGYPGEGTGFVKHKIIEV